jgi:hypothetical protein
MDRENLPCVSGPASPEASMRHRLRRGSEARLDALSLTAAPWNAAAPTAPGRSSGGSPRAGPGQGVEREHGRGPNRVVRRENVIEEGDVEGQVETLRHRRRLLPHAIRLGRRERWLHFVFHCAIDVVLRKPPHLRNRDSEEQGETTWVCTLSSSVRCCSTAPAFSAAIACTSALSMSAAPLSPGKGASAGNKAARSLGQRPLSKALPCTGRWEHDSAKEKERKGPHLRELAASDAPLPPPCPAPQLRGLETAVADEDERADREVATRTKSPQPAKETRCVYGGVVKGLSTINSSHLHHVSAGMPLAT